MKQFSKHLNLYPGRLENFTPKLGPDYNVIGISESHYDPDADLTYINWLDKGNGVFRIDLANLSEEKSDECGRINIVLDDTAMIQQSAGEYDYVRKIAQPSMKRNRKESIPNKKFPARTGYRKGDKEAKFRSKKKKKKICQKPTRSFISLSLVSPNYWREYITQMINDKKVMLRLNIAYNVILISEKAWRTLKCRVLAQTNHRAREASGNALKTYLGTGLLAGRVLKKMKPMLQLDIFLTHFNSQLEAVISHVFQVVRRRLWLMSPTPAERNYGQLKKKSTCHWLCDEKFH
ncbi:hypothetical protein ACTXT7_009269 [Hymenolepis weldensis]